ncbi:replicative DNA helicase [Geitlerinema calcuttense]|uniref:DNA 5'-3' helicase n=1 Tax=Geitlerinema calcuttense NRMC-F 0142 TaxID=2922238 RepID=A0ABT7LV64_9CYAN|nr:replicative DNA helicase [Geitlerinema calcuttense]MDL5055931.1 replicative DNA helicase [Geitlerinema calcuttense NRMC-F 0142]
MSPKRHENWLDSPLPSSEESERVILGAVMMNNDLIKDAAECLEPDDFYSPLNRRVFKAMLSLYQQGKNQSPILIVEEIKKDGPTESFGGVSVISNMAYGVPIFSDIEEYLSIVREKSNLRRLVRICSEITATALSGEDETKVIFDEAQKKINDLCESVESGVSTEYFIPLWKVIDNEVLPALENLRYGKTRKLPTGFKAIDAAIGGGISPSDVLLLAADTGAGKSALALQMAYQLSISGTPTAFLAGEMTNGENVQRLLSQLSGITNLNWLNSITESEYQVLCDWVTAIRGANIRFDHRISDMATLRTHIRSVVQRDKIKALVIDYIQLFKMDKIDHRKRNERIAEASQEVKRIANELEIAVIEVAQFNREGAKSAQPGLHDLEGSGQLEKDASLIFILELGEHELHDQKNRKYRDAKIRIVKGRNVGRGEVMGKFYARSVQFDFEQIYQK